VLLLFEPRDVVVGDFFEGVEGDNVIDVHVHALVVEAVGDALQFLPVLLVDVGPENVLGGIAEEVPVALGAGGVVPADGFEGVLDFRREERAVLVTDVAGRAFQVNVDPFAFLEAPGVLEHVGVLGLGRAGAYEEQGEAA
jgi:hypothetical protein